MDRIAKLKELLVEYPQDNFLQHALALEYIKLGNDTAARPLFEAILSRDENYIGSYYHLARLLDRNGQRKEALKWYEKGISRATATGDHHALNELRSAYDELSD